MKRDSTTTALLAFTFLCSASAATATTPREYVEKATSEMLRPHTNNVRNFNSNRNAQHQGQRQHQGQHQGQGQQQSIRDSGNSSSRSTSTGIGVGGSQSQSNANRVNAGNNNGNVSNAGNNTGTSASSSSASQTNVNGSTGNVTKVEGDTTIYQAQQRNPVSSATAAALTSGNDTCMGSTSIGAQGVGVGMSFGSTWTDANCVMLKNSTMLWNIGKPEAAVALLCSNEQLREALELSGTECPQTARAREEAKTAKHDVNDPYIAARVRRSASR